MGETLVEPVYNVAQVTWTIGDVVRKLREAKKLTLRELAKKAGVAVGALSLLENDGERTEQRTIYRVAVHGLGVSVAELYAVADPPTLSLVEREVLALWRQLEVDQQAALLESAGLMAENNRAQRIAQRAGSLAAPASASGPASKKSQKG